MSYVRHILQPDERLLATGHLHWIGFWRAIVCFAIAVAFLVPRPPAQGMRLSLEVCALSFAALGLIFALHTIFQRWGTEIGVTDRRVIYKRGFIARHTAEMNMDKVETVLVEQSLLGRLFGYGAISIRGSGASIETLRNIADPIGLRNAITAR